ncbi:hypothetical protein HNV12_16265 [Methanococcoides sp. SA1]|nr:hypothetical protein [Methanococcoides sp. SA1]
MSTIYEKLGFQSNPFAYTNADEEDNISDYFIKPPYFDSVIGDYKSPNSCVVLAPRGGGKTAQRKMIEIWSKDNPVLTVTYDRFEFGVNQNLEDIGLPYHLKNIITLTLLNLIFWASDKPEILNKLPKYQKDHLSVLCHNYLGNLTGQDVQQVLTNLKSIPQKIKTYFNENVGIFEPLINYLLKAYDLEKIDMPELKREDKKLDSTYKYQLELLYEIANQLGFEAIYVLIDKVDETELTGNNAENTFKLIRPLIKDLDILGLKGYGFKFFLWDQIYPYYLKEARPDRVPQYELMWTRNELEKLLESRLKAYSNNNIQNLGQIFEDETIPSPDKIVSILGWLSPRNVIRFTNEILSQQSLINSDNNKITRFALERASLVFSKNVANEMYGIEMLKDIQRLDTEIFTINYLSSYIFKTAHINTSRNKVTEWSKAGAIKRIGIEKKPKAKKPVYLYYLRDPRLNRIINSQENIDVFFNKRWTTCQYCNSDILIYKDINREEVELACWNCDKPIFN